MKHAEPVFDASQLQWHLRRCQGIVEACGVKLCRLPFESRNAHLLMPEDRQWEQNRRFQFPALLPPGPGPWREAVLLINGLNDSNYRKFLPWAASLARSGVPTLMFPIAFLVNRRPRAWITPQATEQMLSQRRAVAASTATPANAVLSARIAARPRSLLHDLAQTRADLEELMAQIGSMGLRCEHSGVPLLEPGTRLGVLGYSLGGYLALWMLLSAGLPASCRVMTFCAGASSHGPPDESTNAVSPYILDRDAWDRLSGEIGALTLDGRGASEHMPQLLELYRGTSPQTRAALERAGARLLVCASAGDHVVPARGIERNLGRLDHMVAAGSHEYPFNLADINDADAYRQIADSHRVRRAYVPMFEEFLDLALAHFTRDDARAASETAHSAVNTSEAF